MSLPQALPEIDTVRLGALVVRADLNHRSGRNAARVQEYVRLLQNGEAPPPLKVHRKTNVVVDGLHRFFAMKHFYGDNWEQARVPVLWLDDLPDPDTEPEAFLVVTAAENRHNGEPFDRRDVIKLIRLLVDKLGKQAAREYAADLNETPSSFDEIVRSLYPPDVFPFSRTQIQEKTNRSETAEQRVMETTRPAPTVYQQVSAPISHLRASRPPIMAACRTLRNTIEEARGDFTEAELSEMEHTYTFLGGKLDK